MFIRESDMALAASRWLKAAGMGVKPEFITPWGICDLVGVKFNKVHVRHRLKLRQTSAVSSITRAVLLLNIPDVTTKKSITLKKLVLRYAPLISEEVVFKETERLLADRFVVPTSRGGLQKVNGWMPLQERLVAVELKLSRIDEAMHQAMNNLGFTNESYVGLPKAVARRVASNTSRWSEFFNRGVGVLSITPHGCKVLVHSRKKDRLTDLAIQLYCVEKFWSTRLKGN